LKQVRLHLLIDVSIGLYDLDAVGFQGVEAIGMLRERQQGGDRVGGSGSVRLAPLDQFVSINRLFVAGAERAGIGDPSPAFPQAERRL
jgi:hypothetical protein